MSEPIVCVDVGSTFTKAAAIGPDGSVLALAQRPTTVGTDVLDGLDAAVAALDLGPVPDALILACSSAGGGLRLAVVGHERVVSAEAGRRVALSAGARVVAITSGRLDVAATSALAESRPDVVLLPKVESGHDLHILAAECRRRGVVAATSLWAMIETTGSLLSLEAIAETGRSLDLALDALVVGTNDIAKETGVDPGEERRYLLPWLMQVILVGRRHRLTVLDGVWNDFGDDAGFERETRQSVRIAFDGKTLIHPRQVEPANRLFSPDPERVAEAGKIVAAFAEPAHQGANVINLDGRMVERLHYEQARLLLARQAAILAKN